MFAERSGRHADPETAPKGRPTPILAPTPSTISFRGR